MTIVKCFIYNHIITVNCSMSTTNQVFLANPHLLGPPSCGKNEIPMGLYFLGGL